MRIDAINQATQAYGLSNVKPVNKVDKVKKTDELQISRSGKDYQIAKQAIANTSDVREDKIKEIKQGLASGTYNVSAEEVAEKIVSSYFDVLA